MMEPIPVVLTLSDPWEIGESLEWKPQKGYVIDFQSNERGGRLLVNLNNGILYKDVLYEFVVASPRHEGKSLSIDKLDTKTFCSFTGISNEHAKSENALSLEHWRGGLAFIGDLILEK